jgi:RimJ/RimL family protein N-acetyltransferase
MQSGQIFHTFTAKDGQEVILRSLKWEDLDDCLTLINALIDEQADIYLSKPISRDAEIEWLSNRLAATEKDEVVQIVAEVDEHVIANSELEIKTGLRSHVGDIGIIIKQGYRDIGIGTEILKLLITQARERGLKMATLRVFETNKRAKHVYKKLGFRECGRVPGEIFKNGQYIDHITMVKIIGNLATEC